MWRKEEGGQFLSKFSEGERVVGWVTWSQKTFNRTGQSKAATTEWVWLRNVGFFVCFCKTYSGAIGKWSVCCWLPVTAPLPLHFNIKSCARRGERTAHLTVHVIFLGAEHCHTYTVIHTSNKCVESKIQTLVRALWAIGKHVYLTHWPSCSEVKNKHPHLLSEACPDLPERNRKSTKNGWYTSQFIALLGGLTSGNILVKKMMLISRAICVTLNLYKQEIIVQRYFKCT